MKQNKKFIIAVILVIAILAWSISGVVAADEKDTGTTSAVEIEEFTDTESATCVAETDDAIEDTGCGSKYFPSE